MVALESLYDRVNPGGSVVVRRLARPDVLLAVVLGALGSVLMALRLLVPVPVGMANNGDGSRLMCHIGADVNGPPEPSARWLFARFAYDALPPDASCTNYRSTQLLQLKITAWLHDLWGLPGVIDTRELIVQDCILAGLAIGVMVWLLRKSALSARVLVAAALFLVIADATFADFVASPFSEPAALIGVLTVALAGVAVVAGRQRRATFLIAVIGAMLAVGAKTSTMTLALPFVVFFATQSVDLPWLRSRLSRRVLPAVGALSIAATAAWVTSGQPPHFEKINVANVVTMTIMPQSADPGEVAVELGFPRSFGRYSGSHWWSQQPIHADAHYPANRDLLTRANLAGYLASHPAGAIRLLASGADDYLAFRLDYLGTYPEDAGRGPGSQECRLCLLPTISRAFVATGIAGIAAYWLTCAIAAGFLVRRSDPDTLRRGFAIVALTLIGCTMVQYVTAVAGEGNEVVKHLVIALYAAALAPIWLLAGALVPRREARFTMQPCPPVPASSPLS